MANVRGEAVVDRAAGDVTDSQPQTNLGGKEEAVVGVASKKGEPAGKSGGLRAGKRKSASCLQ